MPMFVIERYLPGAARLGDDELRRMASDTVEVLASLGVPYRWHRSYVAGDKIYCVHETESVEAVVEHARRGGLPADLVVEVSRLIGPETAAS